ncbi:MAG: AI-2E family transporter [Firmicutes bacterium]|nr:AI-2E family transporter [Bacillota bacterium]
MNKEPEKFDFRTFKKGEYFKAGLTIFLVGLALIICFYYITHFSVITAAWRKINKILTPFYIGLIMSYLLCPLYNWAVGLFYKLIKKKARTPKKALKLSRALGTLVAMIVMVAVIVGVVLLIIPSMYDSIVNLVDRMPGYFQQTQALIENASDSDNKIVQYLGNNMDDISERVTNWFQEKVLPASSEIVAVVSSSVVSTIKGVINFFIAIVITVYVLNSKEKFIAQVQKLILSVFSRERAEKIFELGRITNTTFGGFISGKVMDSVIIGILCYILLLILKIPMAVLIAVIIGVTNIIPFFGPFIGAVPSALLLVIISPMAALKFIIMVFALQQVDGYIIGPKILGNTTRLSGFWVMFAILVGGGLFGFPGMILGVPVFAVIYIYCSRVINKSLKRKDIETNTLTYEDFTKYSIDKAEVFGKAAEPYGIEGPEKKTE